MGTATQAVKSFVSTQEQRGREVVDQAKQVATHVSKAVSETAGRAALVGLGLAKTGFLLTAAGIAVGAGVAHKTYKIVRHPIQTAKAIGKVFDDVRARVSQTCKQRVVQAEEKFIDANNRQIAERLRGMTSISPSQRTVIAQAVTASSKDLLELQKRAVDESNLLALPFKSVFHSFRIWLADRAHKRLLGALDGVKSFADTYQSLYPDQCRGFTDDLVNRMKDGKMTLVESLSLKVKMGMASMRNKLVLFALKALPDPFENVASAKRP